MSPSAASRVDSRGQSDPPEVDETQIAERLRWTPRQRLEYLLDILAFEERAQAARRVDANG